MKKSWAVSAALAILLLTACAAISARDTSGDNVMKNNENARVMSVIAKLASGSEITVAAVGGSITTGFAANPPADKGWAGHLGRWWQEKARQSGASVKFINAGVSGTDSAFASVRLEDHVLAKNADIVFVEFAMNDQWLDPAVRRRSYEGILRRILQKDGRAAVCLFVNERGEPYRGQQYEQQPICEYYGVPFVSWLDFVKSSANKGSRNWNDFFDGTENIHPNNDGHESIFHAIETYLEPLWAQASSTAAQTAAGTAQTAAGTVQTAAGTVQTAAGTAQTAAGTAQTAAVLPPPLTDDSFQQPVLLSKDSIEPFSNSGWNKGSPVHSEWVSRGNVKQGWSTTVPDAEMTFKITAKAVGIMYAESDKFRNAEAWVEYPDGTLSKKAALSCYSSIRSGYLGWAYKEVVRSDTVQPFILHVKVRKSRSTDNGKEANITGIIASQYVPQQRGEQQ